MKSYYIEKAPVLTGFKPSYHWAKTLYGVEGDSIIGFVSPKSHLSFPQDHEPEAPDLPTLHIIIEHFNLTQKEAILCQWYFSKLVCEKLGRKISCDGPQILIGELPLSLNKLIWRPISSIIYLGLPITTPPKPPSGKEEKLWYDEIKLIALTVMKQYCTDFKTISLGHPL